MKHKLNGYDFRWKLASRLILAQLVHSSLDIAYKAFHVTILISNQSEVPTAPRGGYVSSRRSAQDYMVGDQKYGAIMVRCHSRLLGCGLHINYYYRV